MFTDMVGYTALAQSNESSAMALLEEYRRIVRLLLPKFGGREVKTIGDAFLVEFASALEAVKCAYAVQQALHELNSGRPDEKRVLVRIGVHSGDVIHELNDVYGDSVNVASRIEPLAAPGGICVSEEVYRQVKNKFELPLVSIGKRELKNLVEPLEVFRVVQPWERDTGGTAIQDVHRIAVLPFASFSPDPNDSFLADGITDEIITTVAGISGLSVISRTSIMGYKNNPKKVEEIGRELKVGSILEGSFKKAGNKIRVTTQLIDVASDRHLWSQNYDRNLDDVFEVQSDIAKRVADALKVRILTPEKERIDKKPTLSTTAYTLYLKGRYHWGKRELEDMKKAAEYFEQSTREDPRFALGYVGEADCYLLLRNNFGIEKELNLARADEKVARALELDSGLAEGHTTKAMILNTRYEYEEAEREFKEALTLNPSYATAHQWYYWLLRNQYRWSEALQEIERALELDPLSPTMILNRSDILLILGKPKEAFDEIEVAEKLGVANMATLLWKAALLLYSGRKSEAAEYVDKASKIDPKEVNVLAWRGLLEFLDGNYLRAGELWDDAVAEGKKRSVDVRGFQADFAMLNWQTGDKEKGLRRIEELKGLPEDTKEAKAFKLAILTYTYAGVSKSEEFFSSLAELVRMKGADFGLMRLASSQMPQSVALFKDSRWRRTFNDVGLESD